MSLSSKTILLLLLSSTFFFSGNPIPAIGVTYTQDPSRELPRPDRIISFLRQSLAGITHVRLPNPNSDLIRSFSYSGISLLLSIPNSLIPQFASEQSAAAHWLSLHVFPFYPRTKITTISVGNNLLSSPDLSHLLLPAIKNVYLALHNLGIRKISISTAHSFDIITNPFPPSAAQFQESVSTPFLKPLLDFLFETNSSFLINIYPYHFYRSNPEIPIGFALFEDHQAFNFRDDSMTGLRYRNLFDVMVDSVISAMAAIDHDGIPVVVETGWPSEGDANEPEATQLYAGMYVEGLMKHLRSSFGTPLRREGVTEVYVFELFDEELKLGATSGQHWGIFYPNFTNKYGIEFSGCNRGGVLMEMIVGFWVMVVLLQ
ncbi:glycosyl hydrolase superfamily protein [Tasmannia lanceolata]|uniref:glycosyl hydrolase superfamily protein n=1 Tax=Tasmannia lanceolata TaxID=3420 RepID=UPI0040643BA9